LFQICWQSCQQNMLNHGPRKSRKQRRHHFCSLRRRRCVHQRKPDLAFSKSKVLLWCRRHHKRRWIWSCHFLGRELHLSRFWVSDCELRRDGGGWRRRRTSVLDGNCKWPQGGVREDQFSSHRGQAGNFFTGIIFKNKMKKLRHFSQKKSKKILKNLIKNLRKFLKNSKNN